jgi:hypothetical protein
MKRSFLILMVMAGLVAFVAGDPVAAPYYEGKAIRITVGTALVAVSTRGPASSPGTWGTTFRESRPLLSKTYRGLGGSSRSRTSIRRQNPTDSQSATYSAVSSWGSTLVSRVTTLTARNSIS